GGGWGAAPPALQGPRLVAMGGYPRRGAPRAAARAAAGTYAPSLILAGGEGAGVAGLPLLEGRSAPLGGALAFVCEGFRCALPTADPTVLAEQLRAPDASGTSEVSA
ncbi:MAG: hypothetical protein KJZ74_08365, partial [Gemmatimonadales bacterium]|nr:hypothetical protein [Gemmatimonadales bacterium]